MGRNQRWTGGSLTTSACYVLMIATGCHLDYREGINRLPAVYDSMPRELSKVVMPEYVIEPPDILTIEGVHVMPKSPYSLTTMDVLAVQVTGTLPEAPISGLYSVEPGGVLNLGPIYGTVKVTGMTIEQAKEAIQLHLQSHLKQPVATITLAQMSSTPQLFGQFLVGPDGMITLGSYGSVSVVGKSVTEAKQVIEDHLSQYLDSPIVALSVYGYNSKVYYVILQGAGLGDAVYRFPVTGNETVLDALAQINGMEEVSSKKVWVARPSNDSCTVQIMPVDWCGVTEQGLACTNYQLLPGDRVFIAEDHLVAFDTHLAKLISPLERIMGFSLLGVDTVSRFSGNVLEGGGLRGRFGLF